MKTTERKNQNKMALIKCEVDVTRFSGQTQKKKESETAYWKMFQCLC